MAGDKKNIAAAALNEVPAGKLGKKLFDAISRLVVCTGIECVIMRKRAGKAEVLLTKRGPGEAYANMWHVPGSFIRVGESEVDVFERVGRKELGTRIIDPKFIGYHNDPGIERGQVIQLIFLCDVKKGSNGTWFSVDDLPIKMVENHRKVLIPIARKHFQKNIR